MTPSAVNCSTKYTVFSHALHFCCVPANAIAPSHTTAVVFFYLLRRTEEEEKKQEQKLKEEKTTAKTTLFGGGCFFFYSSSALLLPFTNAAKDGIREQRKRTHKREESLSLSLYRRRRSSRPRLHSVNADTVNKQHRLGFSFFSIFGGVGVPLLYDLFIYFQFCGGDGGDRGFCTFYNPPSPT
jgi:hypothetical protein